MNINKLKLFAFIAGFGLFITLLSFYGNYFYFKASIQKEFYKDADTITILTQQHFSRLIDESKKIMHVFKVSEIAEHLVDIPDSRSFAEMQQHLLLLARTHPLILALEYKDIRSSKILHVEKKDSNEEMHLVGLNDERYYAPQKNVLPFTDHNRIRFSLAHMHLGHHYNSYADEAHLVLQQSIFKDNEVIGEIYMAFSMEQFLQELHNIELINLTVSDDKGDLYSFVKSNSDTELKALFPDKYQQMLEVKDYKDGQISVVDLPIDSELGLKLIAQVDLSRMDDAFFEMLKREFPMLAAVMVMSLLLAYFLGRQIAKLQVYLDSVIASMGEGVFVLDRHHRVRKMNPSGEKILGYTGEELFGKNSHDIIHPSERDGTIKPFETCPIMMLEKNQKKLIHELDVFKKKNGEFIDVDIMATPLIIDGSYEGSVTLFKDITQELEQKRQLELDAMMLESLSDAVFVIDATGKIVYANERAVIERGYSKEELLSFRIGAIDAPDHQVDAKQMAEKFAQKEAFFLRTVHQRKDKSTFPVEASIKFITLQGEELAISVVRDITKQVAAEAELRESEEKYRLLVQNSLIGIFRTTTEGEILYANGAAKEILGYSEHDDESHYNIEDCYDNIEERHKFLEKLQKYGGVEKYEIRLRSKYGEKKTGLLSAEIHDNVITGVLLDITDRVEATQRLLELSQIVEQVDDMVLMTDTEGKVTYVNDAFVARTGFSRKELLNMPSNILKSGQMEEKFYKKLWAVITSGKTFIDTFVNKKSNGEIFYEYKTITPIKDTNGKIIAYVSSGKDITERINMEERLKELSEKDHLTGLYNRLKIDELLENNIKLKKRYGHRFSLIMVDIDHFKSVNDIFGHDEGDRVLKEFADVLKRRLRTSDELGRWGGEEFMIVLPHTTLEDAVEIAESIRKSVQMQVVLPNDTQVTISAGVCEFEEDDTMQQIIKKADDALYKAKDSGRNRVLSCKD